MARFRVNELSYVGFSLAQPGAEVVMTRKDEAHAIDANLSPIDDEAQAWVDSQKDAHPDKSKGEIEAAPRKPRAKKAETPVAQDDEGGAEGTPGDEGGGLA